MDACELIPLHTSGILDAPDASAEQPVAVLFKVDGPVTVERGGRRVPATPGPLYLRDKLSTGDGAAAELRFGDGREVDIGSNADLNVEDGHGGVVLRIARGMVISRVSAEDEAARGGKNTVRVSLLTPYGLTRINPGESEVAVDVGSGKASVDIRLGSVQFVSNEGETTDVAAGKMISLIPGKIQVVERVADAPTLTIQPIEVFIAAATGKAEIRKTGSTRWAKVTDGEALASGDAVRVKIGRAKISFSGTGSDLWLERNSELAVVSGTSSTEIDESHLDLRRGSVTLNLSDKRRTRLLFGKLALETAGGMLNVTRTRTGLEVNAITGDVLLKQEGQEERSVRAGQIATVHRSGAVKVRDLHKAEFVLRTTDSRNNYGTKIFHSGIGQMALQWRGGEGAYQVQISEDAAFEQIVITGKVYQPWVNLLVPARGALYWRIFKEDGVSRVEAGSATFAPEPPFKDLNVLRNRVPDNSEKTTILYQDKPPAVTLTYKPRDNARSHRIRLFRRTQLTQPLVDKEVSESEVALESGMLNEGSYVWSVTPISHKGEEMEGGKMNALEMVYDNAVPNLLIYSPKNGEHHVRGPVVARGVAPVGTRLWINAQPAELDDKNRFEALVAPTGNSRLVVFRVSRSASSADAYTVRALRRSK